jgi:GNAT acetyltransferase-like protein
MKREIWSQDVSAQTLLDSMGGPFSTRAFREAVINAVPGWRDVSFGARSGDGALAAVPLLARAWGAESVPPEGYGGVVASRALEVDETLSFLELAARKLRVSRLGVRSLELAGNPVAGTRLATASVVPVDTADPPGARYARLARRSLKKATDAGATVAASESVDDFWPVYAAAAQGRAMIYPEALVRRLVDDGVARLHAVRLSDRVVASMLTLVGGSHWMCWLAGQTEEGRLVAASYLAYDAVFNEAQAAGVTAVNLGASVGGGAEFKRHLGATEVWMREWKHETVPAAAFRIAHNAAASLAHAARARIR